MPAVGNDKVDTINTKGDLFMYRKIIIAAAALITAASLAACGEKKEKTPAESDIFSETSSVVSEKDGRNESLSSEAVKELESIPGLDSDSVSAEESTDTENDTPSELETKGESVEVGGLTLSASEIPFSDAVKLTSKETDAAVSGDTMYLLAGKKLDRYTLADKATKETTTELSGAYDRIDTDPYGQVYLSREKFDCAVLNGSGELEPIDTTGRLSMSKVMEYGLCTSGGKITKYSDESSGEWSSISEREVSFPDNVSAVEFAGNHILVAHKTDGESTVDVFDYDGNTLATAQNSAVGDEITAMTETSGVIAASSCGDLCLWDESGDTIGRLSSDDTARLFGSDSPVIIRKMFAQDDGGLLAFCENSETSEAHLYKISV